MVQSSTIKIQITKTDPQNRIAFVKFFIRLDWPFFKPAAGLNLEPRNFEP